MTSTFSGTIPPPRTAKSIRSFKPASIREAIDSARLISVVASWALSAVPSDSRDSASFSAASGVLRSCPTCPAKASSDSLDSAILRCESASRCSECAACSESRCSSRMLTTTSARLSSVRCSCSVNPRGWSCQTHIVPIATPRGVTSWVPA